METLIHLTPSMFSEKERTLTESGSLVASTFRFESGVCGLRLTNEIGELVLLPFQGQQVWSASFYSRLLVMRSLFSQPRVTREFLETFGGFLQHCGISGTGGPSPQDTHPLHGELPNAPYERAHLLLGEDKSGPYIGMGGAFERAVFFGPHYLAEPEIRLHAGNSRFRVSMRITNQGAVPLELMYLAHVNFRPVDEARLVYSALPTPEHVRVRTTIPGHIKPGPGYREFIAELHQQPEKHHRIVPGQSLDPEVVFFIDYLADEDGWAHTLQILPDGSADYIRHRLDPLKRGTRWISRTPDQDAIALVEPGTAEPEGYLAARAKGDLVILPPGGRFQAEMEIGALLPAEARQVEAAIQTILAGRAA